MGGGGGIDRMYPLRQCLMQTACRSFEELWPLSLCLGTAHCGR